MVTQCPGFGGIRAKELAARGEVKEEVSNRDRSAFRRTLRAVPRLLIVLEADIRAAHRIVLPREEGDIRHRRDAGEGFAAEAEGAYIEQVCFRSYLAGGVALESQGKLLGGQADTVVAHADQAAAAFYNIHPDGSGAGVEGVLH